MLAYDGANAIDVIGPLEVFATASRYRAIDEAKAPPPYTIEILAAQRGPIRMHSGITVYAERAYGAVRSGVDTLLVAGGDAREAASDAEIRRWLRRIEPSVRRLGSVCTGAFVLAAAGLLDGRRATTHWRSADALARQFPSVQVEADALFVCDGGIYTSAGVTAGMDWPWPWSRRTRPQAALEVARAGPLSQAPGRPVAVQRHSRRGRSRAAAGICRSGSWTLSEDLTWSGWRTAPP